MPKGNRAYGQSTRRAGRLVAESRTECSPRPPPAGLSRRELDVHRAPVVNVSAEGAGQRPRDPMVGIQGVLVEPDMRAVRQGLLFTAPQGEQRRRKVCLERHAMTARQSVTCARSSRRTTSPV